jgi:hypothetical protein
MLPIVDVSATPPASGSTKRISINNILSSSPTASGALTVTGLVTAGSATITGALTVDTNTLVANAAGYADRVGIGTATPSVPLEIRASDNSVLTTGGSVNFTQFKAQIDSGVGTSIGSYQNVFGYVGTSSNHYLEIRANNIAQQKIEPLGIFSWFDGAGGTRMTLNANGLGVGVTPSAWNSSYRALQIGATGALWQSASGFTFLSDNAFVNSGASNIYITTAGASFYRQNAGVHTWWNAPSGTAGNAITFTQAMTLDATGNLHVGTTAYIGVGSNVVNSLSGFNLVPNNTGNAANRNWQFAANGSAAGNLDFTISSANNTYPNSAYRMQLTSAGALNNTTGTYGTISDLRLKENISDARNYLADLLKLRVVKYSLKEESSAVATKLGFIAQEVEQVFPNLVDQSDKEYDGAEGIRSVKTSILIPMLLKAIQELTARVQTLEAR